MAAFRLFGGRRGSDPEPPEEPVKRERRDPRERILAYHQLTKHDFQAFARGPGWLDWDTQPDPFRRFAGAPELPAAKRVPDLDGPACPLRGVASALAAASGERALVVAGDLPRLSAPLVLGLVAWPVADAVVPCTGAGPQPLCALYRREPVLRAARQRLASGDLALRGLLDVVETSLLDESEVAQLDPR